MLTGAIERRLPTAVLLVLSGLSAARAQPAAPADSINVRLRTEHYAIAGSVSDERLRDYGRALEFIYAEYEKGFAKLLDSAAKSPNSKRGGEKSNAGEKSSAESAKSRQPAAKDKSGGKGGKAGGS